MAKSKHHAPELELLRQELRNLKAQNKHLKKELARATKGLHRLADLEEIVIDDGLNSVTIVVNEKSEKCSECGGETIKLPSGKVKILHHATCPERKKK